MSEYQYYEFRTIDRPLTREEMSALRLVSTRAEITPSSFTNFYTFGDFKGNPATLVERYFDGLLYLANWGTHRLTLRLPRRLLDPKLAGQYVSGESASIKTKGEFVLLDFLSEDEEGDWESDGRGLLAAILPVRGAIASGDLRALYLGWLACVQQGELDDDEREPAVPAGLRELSASLTAFADFLRIDRDLIAVAAETSPDAGVARASARELAAWIAALPVEEKDALLLRAAQRADLQLQQELQQRFQASRASRAGLKTREQTRRTAAQLLASAETRREERERRQAERAAQQRARQEREEAAVRARYLQEMAKRGAAPWREVEALIATRRPGDYDRAVQLLVDLRDVGAQTGTAAEVRARIEQLRVEHSKKPRFLERLAQAGLSDPSVDTRR